MPKRKGPPKKACYCRKCGGKEIDYRTALVHANAKAAIELQQDLACTADNAADVFKDADHSDLLQDHDVEEECDIQHVLRSTMDEYKINPLEDRDDWKDEIAVHMLNIYHLMHETIV